MKKISFTLLFCIFMSTFIYSQKNIIDINQKGSDIKSELTLNEKNQIISFNSAIRARQINFNDQLRSIKNINEGEVIKIGLFNDKSFDAVIKNVITDVNGTKTITSKINGFEFAYCIITISDQATMMKIDIPENKEKYITRMHPQERTTYILQLDINSLDELEGSSPVIPENLNNLKNENSNQEKQNIKLEEPANQLKLGVDDPATIDVMIVYTPAASAWATTNEGSINNTIADAMANANLASSNSGLGITFNLVHSYEVNYTEVTASDDLDALTNNGDGIIDDVHTNRNLYSADMVPMFTLENFTGGLGWLLNNKYGADDIAFCINRVQQASWSYTMIHEMGHNMGAHHHKDQITQAGPTSWTNWAENTWSAGWRWTADLTNYYCDLMTYSGSGDFADGHSSTRIAYFSSPNFTDHGQATGDAVYGDNARTLKEVKHYVAQYKDATTQLYCAAKGVASNYYISNVQIGNINQPSGGSGYSDFSFNATDVTIGINQQLTVSIGNPFSTNQLLVWVDWNNDKDFSDANEAVYISGIASANQYITNINPPVGTTAGEKRMRIRLHISNYGGNTTPCGDSDYGDVEDYTLNVLPSVSTYNVTFNVSDGTNPINGASVVFDGITQTTNSSGQTIYTNKSNGSYNYTITKTGYNNVNSTVSIVNQNVIENVVMSTAVATTTITPQTCGLTTTSLNTIISTAIVSGAQMYEFEFTNTNLGFTQIISNSTNSSYQWVRLNMVPGMLYGRVYNIRSRVKINAVWSSWSPYCNVTLNVPITSITPQTCGLVTSNINSIISTAIITGAQAYEFEFTNSGLGFSQTLSNPVNPAYQYVRLSYVPGIVRGYTYNVRARVKADGMWSAWSNTCTVTLNNISKQNEEVHSFFASNTDFVTYPNPFTNNVNLYINGQPEIEYTITAYDITGKILYNSFGYSRQEITFGKDWVKGMYIISVKGPDYAGSCKVIKTE